MVEDRAKGSRSWRGMMAVKEERGHRHWWGGEIAEPGYIWG